MRAMKRIWILFGILVCLAAAAAGYWYYLNSPRYVLKQVATSMAEHDWETFDTYVDVETVSHNLAVDMGEMTLKVLQQKETSPLLAKGITSLLTNRLTRTFSQDLETRVKGEGSENQRPGLLESVLPPTGSGLKVELQDVRREGPRSVAMLDLGNGSRLEVELQQREAGWIVTRIINTRELLGRLRRPDQPAP